MGGPTGCEPYVIPKYDKFSSIEGLPELELIEKELAKKGLKDPWIRNEAWRYNPGFGTKMQRAQKLFFRGFPLGLGLTIVTVVIEKALGGGGHHGSHGTH